MPVVYSHPVEICAVERGRFEGDPVSMITFRPDPDQCLDTATIMLTQEQVVRMRDTLDRFLNDPESWLYLPKPQQRAMRKRIEQLET